MPEIILKTINGQSLEGGGNLVVGGGEFSGDMDDIDDGATYVKTENNYSDAEKSKLAGIAANATANDTDANLKNTDNHTNGTTNKVYTAVEQTKLAGIATGATANDTDANLKARANHTGTQTAATISDFNTAADARITAATGVSVQGLLTNGYGLSGTTTKAIGLTNASAFATAETTISAATYADIAGCSVSLAAGTWIIFAHVVARAANAIIQCFGAITHSDNTVISESANSRPASGTASLNSPISFSWFAIVSPGSTTTYKLRGARGLTTHTTSWIAMDGTGFNTTNHASNNSDKGTGIFAIRIA